MKKQTSGRGALYRKGAARRVETFEIELPSGAVFLLRRPNLETFAVSGVLPVSLAEKMERAASKGASSEEAFGQLTLEEKEKSFEFANRLLKHICVDPRIVDNPKSDDELAIEDLEAKDLEFLLNWAQSGGGGADRLGNFQ